MTGNVILDAFIAVSSVVFVFVMSLIAERRIDDLD
jgi:hypothetical protein